MDLISIIMPCYNMKNYIAASVATVINQTYTCWELLIIDDCSTDDSIRLIEDFITDDNRIKLIRLEKNSGIAVARNAGLREARGSYIAFLDSDDFWHPEKLQVQLLFMKEKNILFSFTSYEQVRENGSHIAFIECPSVVDYAALLKKNTIGCLTVMIHHSMLENFCIPTVHHEDFAAWLALLRANSINAYGLNKCLAKYNVRKGSTSRNKLRSMGWVYIIYRKQEHLPTLQSLFYLVRWFLQSIK
ncbi:glycosyltransferase family 2 protein [Anaerovorax sp. IOR16]|uniref:glycosyltransferase family 2 protein n=1 Tax=Anaerovorax sp. IOR16 TaxID=2773458 RepID=UPI0019D18D93|nr:glycosyltransferase family 2 protein [Anaerovorax sp. IOR16]